MQGEVAKARNHFTRASMKNELSSVVIGSAVVSANFWSRIVRFFFN